MKTIDKILENNYKNLNGYGDSKEVRRGSGESKKTSEIKINTDKEIKHSANSTNSTQQTSNTTNIQNTTVSQPKYSMQNLLRDEDQKKVTTTSNTGYVSQNSIQSNTPSSSNTTNTGNPTPSKDGMISFKMDPNSSDLKDMKVNVNMDAETAYRLYQDNKKYLPTGQQVLSGMKTTANFAASAANTVTKDDSPLVTGNKPQTKTKDPLTSLFGLGSKATNTKKGQF